MEQIGEVKNKIIELENTIVEAKNKIIELENQNKLLIHEVKTLRDYTKLYSELNKIDFNIEQFNKMDSLESQMNYLRITNFFSLDSNNCIYPLEWLCKNSNEKIIKFVIDVLSEENDLNVKFVNTLGWKLIHIICRYSTPKMIKYILDIYQQKNFTISCETNDGWKPIHFICRYSTPEMIKYILDICQQKNLNIGYETNDGWKPIHIICAFSTFEMIQYILNIYQQENLNIEHKTDNGFQPIHLICTNLRSSYESIEYIINIYEKNNIVLDSKSKKYVIEKIEQKGFNDLVKRIRMIKNKTILDWCINFFDDKYVKLSNISKDKYNDNYTNIKNSEESIQLLQDIYQIQLTESKKIN